MFLVAADEKLKPVSAARDLKTVLLAVAVRERREVRLVEHVVVIGAVDDAAARGLLHQRAGLEAGAAIERHPEVRIAALVWIGERALLGPQAVVRRADAALLRRDHDDAIRRLRAVERRGRGPLDDVDALDLFGIDVVERRRGRSARADAAVARLRVDANAVDVHDRIVVERERRLPADSDARARANGAGADDLDARRPPREQLAGRRDRRFGDLRRDVDRRRPCSRFPLCSARP